MTRSAASRRAEVLREGRNVPLWVVRLCIASAKHKSPLCDNRANPLGADWSPFFLLDILPCKIRVLTQKGQLEDCSRTRSASRTVSILSERLKLLATWADAIHTLRGKDFSCEWYFANSGPALDGAVRFNHDMVTCLLAVNNVVPRF